MALETLNDIEQIGGFGITRYPTDKNENFIIISEEDNCIAFKIQKGPIKEVGINGCQVDTLIETSFLIIREFNGKFPCSENDEALFHLSQAIYYLNERKKNRESRNVEGTSKL